MVAAQPSPPKQAAATTKPDAREIALAVTVRDKHGALVHNLQASDLTLAVDGLAQKIGSLTLKAALPTRLGLVVDTSRGMAAELDGERKAAGKLLDQLLPASPGADQAFLLHFDREVELLEDFTASREDLRRELDEMGPSPRSQSQFQEPETSDDQRDRPRAQRGPQLYDAIFLAADELMKSKDGRKALVVFSDGQDRGSKVTLNDAVDAADHAGLAVFTIFVKGEEEGQHRGIPGLGGGRRGGLGGGGYPGAGGGYPGGSRRSSGGEDRKTEADGRKILEKIATRTGGRFFETRKKENLDEVCTQIVEELHGQYLLTFTPQTTDAEGGFHKIALKANKDDLAVATREGYYGPEGKAK